MADASLLGFLQNLQSGLNSPGFQAGAATFNAGANGTNIGGGLLAGADAANTASKNLFQQQEQQRQLSQQQQRDQMWGQITSGQVPPWAAQLPKGSLDLARVLGPDAGSQFITGLISKSPSIDIERAKLKLAQDKNPAEIGLIHAHTNYFNGRASGTAGGTPEQPARDPLEGWGLDENGAWVPPSAPSTSGVDPRFRFPGTGGTVPSVGGGLGSPAVPTRPPGMMRLGGPVDQPDAPPAPTRPNGVQVAQNGAVPPEIMQMLQNSKQLEGMLGRPKPGTIWTTDARGNPVMMPTSQLNPPPPSAADNMPQLFKDATATANAFGQPGYSSPQIPGIVTGAKSGSTDVAATRAAEGQRAYESSTPEQQKRLLDLRQNQARWTTAWGHPPRAGYYYGDQGQELQLSERNYKGDKEQQALIKVNLDKLDEAGKALTSQTFAGRYVSGTLNYGEGARSFSDLNQVAMGIAYALSGKQVGKAELENFQNAYAPQPGDSEYTINYKIKRMREFYSALKSSNGVTPEQAWDKANAKVLEPDKATPRDPNVDRLRSKYGLE